MGVCGVFLPATSPLAGGGYRPGGVVFTRVKSWRVVTNYRLRSSRMQLGLPQVGLGAPVGCWYGIEQMGHRLMRCSDLATRLVLPLLDTICLHSSFCLVYHKVPRLW